jgi:hypothetical protein
VIPSCQHGGHCVDRPTHLLTNGYEIRTIQELVGHKDVRMTMVYTHVLNRAGRGVTGEQPMSTIRLALIGCLQAAMRSPTSDRQKLPHKQVRPPLGIGVSI